MGTIVLLAAFVLSVSATPLGSSFRDYIVERSGADNDWMHYSNADGDSTAATELPTQDNESNNDEESEHHTHSSQEPSDDVNANTDDQPPTSLVPATSTEAQTSNQPSTVPETTEEVYTTQVDLRTILPNENVTQPPDADPSDCQNATATNHTFLLCTYICGEDEVLVAANLSKCYLNQTKTTPGLLGVRNRAEATETGICVDGECIRPSPQYSTSTSTTDTSMSTSTEPSTSFPTTEAPTKSSLNENNSSQLID